MSFELNKQIKNLTENQRQAAFNVAWYGLGQRSLELFPAQVYKKTFELIEQAIYNIKQGESNIICLADLHKELFEKISFYSWKAAKTLQDKDENTKIRLRFEAITNTLEDIKFLDGIKAELKQQELNQFTELRKRFGFE